MGYTVTEFEQRGPEPFRTGQETTLRKALSTPGVNVVLQAAIIQPQTPDREATTNDLSGPMQGRLLKNPLCADEIFGEMGWKVITAVRGPGRSEGVVSTPTKNMPPHIAHGLADASRLLDVRWQPATINNGLDDELTAFFINTSSLVKDILNDYWHTGPDYRDLLTNEVQNLLVGKFGQAIKPQMQQNHNHGVPSYFCRQIHWTSGYSAEIDLESSTPERPVITNIEPNIMLAVLVVANSNLPFEWANEGDPGDYEYAAFGPTSLEDLDRGIGDLELPGAKLLAPYATDMTLQRSATSMCTEVTYRTINQLAAFRTLRDDIATYYYHKMSPFVIEQAFQEPS